MERKVWRYHDYESRLDYTTKRATIKNALQKVHYMASDYDQLAISAMAKCKEFMDLNYPKGILKHYCTRMFVETRVMTWIEIRFRL